MDREKLRQAMDDFVEKSPLNRVVGDGEVSIERIFDYPLIGVAAARDPLFTTLKEEDVVGEQHLSPEEWLPGAVTVLSYFLPFSETVRTANRKQGLPALEWVYGRYEGEMFNDALRRHLVGLLAANGGRAIAPVLTADIGEEAEAGARFQVSDRKSNWSERHVAYIAGLGTFSLGKNLITARGCAGRFGSAVTDLFIQPDTRPYTKTDEYCTYCLECVDRCPAGAITAGGKDKILCEKYSRAEIVPRFKPRYGCGKCQTAVACEREIP